MNLFENTASLQDYTDDIVTFMKQGQLSLHDEFIERIVKAVPISVLIQ